MEPLIVNKIFLKKQNKLQNQKENVESASVENDVDKYHSNLETWNNDSTQEDTLLRVGINNFTAKKVKNTNKNKSKVNKNKDCELPKIKNMVLISSLKNIPNSTEGSLLINRSKKNDDIKSRNSQPRICFGSQSVWYFTFLII